MKRLFISGDFHESLICQRPHGDMEVSGSGAELAGKAVQYKRTPGFGKSLKDSLFNECFNSRAYCDAINMATELAVEKNV